MVPFLILSTLLQIGAIQSALNPADRAQEIALMHAQLDPGQLRRMQVWDDKAADWRDTKPAEVLDDKSSVLIIHFWATWCAPCREEFPIWRELAPKLEAQYKGRLRVLFVAVQSAGPDMEAFVAKNRASLPLAPLYQDTAERLTDTLRRRVTGERLSYPVTVWLDPQRVVRQALVGSVRPRRSELVDSTERLLKLFEPGKR